MSENTMALARARLESLLAPTAVEQPGSLASVVAGLVADGLPASVATQCAEIVKRYVQSPTDKSQVLADLDRVLAITTPTAAKPGWPGAPAIENGALITFMTSAADRTLSSPQLKPCRSWHGDFKSCNGQPAPLHYDHPTSTTTAGPFAMELVVHRQDDGTVAVSCDYHFGRDNLARVDPRTGEFGLRSVYGNNATVTVLNGRLWGDTGTGTYSSRDNGNIRAGEQSGCSTSFTTNVRGGLGGICADDRGRRNHTMLKCFGQFKKDEVGRPTDHVHQVSGGLMQTFVADQRGTRQTTIITLRDGAGEAFAVRKGFAAAWLANPQLGMPTGNAIDSPLGSMQLFEQGYILYVANEGCCKAFAGAPDLSAIGTDDAGQVYAPIRAAVTSLNTHGNTYTPVGKVSRAVAGGAYQVMQNSYGEKRYVTLADGAEAAHYLSQDQWDAWHQQGGPARLGWPTGGEDTLSSLCGNFRRPPNPYPSFEFFAKILPFQSGGIVMSCWKTIPPRTDRLQVGAFLSWKILSESSNVYPAFRMTI